MIAFRMPSLGADMEAGTLVEWLKKPGDRVKRGDIIAVVETQKSAIEIEVFADGVVDTLFVEPGARVPVGEVMATIRATDESPGSATAFKPPPAAPTPAAVVADRAQAPEKDPAAGWSLQRRVTPAARRRASELSLDLEKIPTGSDGVIGLDQVEAVSRSEPSARMSGIAFEEMRRAIGAAMVRSHREVPHYYVSTTIDVTSMLDWLERQNAERGVSERLHYAAPLIRAVARALVTAPELNGHFIEGRFQAREHVHLGIAVAMRGGGLIAPALLAAETLDLDSIMDRLRDVVARVRGGRLRSSEMTEGTATLSNLGERTADTVLPLIYPPQVAIIGCGQIVERPWVRGGKIVPAKVMTVTVGGDHRVSDGRRAALFLSHLDKLLQTPEAA